MNLKRTRFVVAGSIYAFVMAGKSSADVVDTTQRRRYYYERSKICKLVNQKNQYLYIEWKLLRDFQKHFFFNVGNKHNIKRKYSRNNEINSIVNIFTILFLLYFYNIRRLRQIKKKHNHLLVLLTFPFFFPRVNVVSYQNRPGSLCPSLKRSNFKNINFSYYKQATARDINNIIFWRKFFLYYFKQNTYNIMRK